MFFFFLEIRKTGVKDVTFKVLYCGICHSDLHKLKNEWSDSIYPLVPGYDLYFLFNNVWVFFYLASLAKFISR